jgi:F-type H+-transporting ATPase subunit gamma
MATLRDIRRRIRSVENTKQITRAMEMVAAAKLRRSQNRVVAARPYARKMEEVLGALAVAAQSLSHPLFEERPVARRAVVVLASDRGLCGAYNGNILRLGEETLRARPRGENVLVTIGKRGQDYFRRRGWTPRLTYTDIPDPISVARAREITDALLRLYLEREVDEVILVYTKFVSALTRTLVAAPFLPIRPPAGGGKTAPADYIFEPGPERIFETLLPRYAVTRIMEALLEARASEHAARMVAMGSATKNAEEMIRDLSLIRNRARQAAITKEISELVGGAEALK